MLDSKTTHQANNILACDVGLKRIGLAQYTQSIILPIEPILRKNRNQASLALSALLSQKCINTLVVGLPNGGEAHYEDTRTRIRHFIHLIHFGGEIVYINEDYTSQEALQDLAYLGRESRALAQKNGRLDSLSACYILERYIATLNL